MKKKELRNLIKEELDKRQRIKEVKEFIYTLHEKNQKLRELMRQSGYDV